MSIGEEKKWQGGGGGDWPGRESQSSVFLSRRGTKEPPDEGERQ